MRTIQEVTVYRILEDGEPLEYRYDCGGPYEFDTREEAEAYLNPPLRMWCQTKQDAETAAMLSMIGSRLKAIYAPRVMESVTSLPFFEFPARR